ncbi:UDP-2,3-diacylglucosamine diphosphatase LpxI [Kaistia dalseonensis]|uniref:DUF1009 family protein n=1 Tax=Kaistia dalseonensis TaxID=410840 RepID=A0ABU0H109_9HYPH|nr:UDP-2,3-diacylglucosamine diphosphatase LpxI [Kaistia dalseonensis]MCX5493432.1 UDP-2,3-diacylglucosamine diphosphatase LpxI [Kaistia dalseonensis]MDQ0435991.1 DUF1009 family protein [Kaistia dalseonensis]
MSEAAPTSNAVSDLGPIGIICGGGAFPVAVAEAARKSGRGVVLFPLKGFADDPRIATLPHEWIGIGMVGALMNGLRRRGCRQVVFVGIVMRPRMTQIRFDWTAVRLLPRFLKLLKGGDNHLLSGIGRIFEDQGFELLGAHQVAPSILVPEGVLGRIQPSAAELDDARLGMDVIRQLGPFDIGQGVVVARRHVLAVEAAEGTDLMLERCRALRSSGRVKLAERAGVLVKAPKPSQDRRMDLPSVGIKTIERAAEAGLAGVAVEAGGVIAVESEAMIKLADKHGLFLVGIAE